MIVAGKPLTLCYNKIELLLRNIETETINDILFYGRVMINRLELMFEFKNSTVTYIDSSE